VNVNTADAAALETLPGIGEVLAGAIIQYRTEHGPFRSVDELEDVSGIGPATLEKLRPLVTV
jgi:competence protein ComEA